MDLGDVTRHLQWAKSRAVQRIALLFVVILAAGWWFYLPTPISPFAIDSALWADGGPEAIGKPIPLPFEVSPVKKRGMVVPNAVHYIYLANNNGTSVPMWYWQYLAVKSVLEVQQPDVVYFHYDHEPFGPWWDELKELVTPNKVFAPEKVWGQKIRLSAHKSDVIRIKVLQKLGGVYSDMDTFWVRPIDDLMYAPYTMGLQGALKGNYRGSEGLGNGVIASIPNAPFLDRWLIGYQDFHGEWYNYNGVRKSYEIARAHPEEIQVVNGYAFYYPLWDQNIKMYETDEYDWDTHTGYTYHAWNSLAYEWLEEMNPVDVLERDTGFHRLCRRFMGPRDVEIYEEILASDEAV